MYSLLERVKYRNLPLSLSVKTEKVDFSNSSVSAKIAEVEFSSISTKWKNRYVNLYICSQITNIPIFKTSIFYIIHPDAGYISLKQNNIDVLNSSYNTCMWEYMRRNRHVCSTSQICQAKTKNDLHFFFNRIECNW